MTSREGRKLFPKGICSNPGCVERQQALGKLTVSSVWEQTHGSKVTMAGDNPHLNWAEESRSTTKRRHLVDIHQFTFWQW